MDASMRETVRKRANGYCEYCHMPELATPIVPFQVEHIIAKRQVLCLGRRIGKSHYRNRNYLRIGFFFLAFTAVMLLLLFGAAFFVDGKFAFASTVVFFFGTRGDFDRPF